MKRTLVLLILLTITAAPIDAGWFSRDKDNVHELERQQRLRAEEQLKKAEGKIDDQQRSISRLQLTITVTVTGAVILLLVGIALGTKTTRDGLQQ